MIIINYKYLGILEADTIEQTEMIERIIKESSDEQETKLCSRNLIKGINALASHLCKILGIILKMDKEGT